MNRMNVNPNPIFAELECIMKLGVSGKQKHVYECIYNNIKLVKVVKMSELPQNVYDAIKNKIKFMNIRIKECYNNSLLAVVMLEDCLKELGYAISYVEGKTTACGIPIDHAFNKIENVKTKKSYYVDFTIEVLKLDDCVSKSYASINEIESHDLMDAIDTYKESYFPWYITKYNNTYEKE